MKLFDRQDSEGVDWCLIGETLFKTALDVLDRLPDDNPLKRKQALAEQVHADAYDRMVGNSEAVKTGEGRSGSPPTNTAEPRSPGTRPPR